MSNRQRRGDGVASLPRSAPRSPSFVVGMKRPRPIDDDTPPPRRGISTSPTTHRVPRSESESSTPIPPVLLDSSEDEEYSSTSSEGSTRDLRQLTEVGPWRLVNLIAEGNNGQVHIGWRGDGAWAAVKLETRSSVKSHLRREVKVLDRLGVQPGIPLVLGRGVVNDREWMAMQLLGPSLADVFHKYEFCEATIVYLALEMLLRLQTLHNAGYIHQSVKPDNFCLGYDSDHHLRVFLIDYGRGLKYITKAGHIQPGKDKGGAFSRWYHSVGAREGRRQSRGDDLQSWAFTLAYFVVGRPFKKWRDDLETPGKYMVEDHWTLPAWLTKCIRYVRGVQFTEVPDYTFLRNVLEAELDPNAVVTTEAFLRKALAKGLPTK